jgi:CelD/BcsL family acetyltransferase involved in cellulose biosynthesis
VRGNDSTVALTAERVPPQAWTEIEDWDEAVDASALPSVFLTRDWISAWWLNFGADLDPCLLRVRAPDGQTLGVVPLYLERLRGSPRRLGLLGDQVVGSEYLGAVARGGAEADVASAAAEWLAVNGPSWHVAELSGLRDGDVAADELERALRTGAARVDEDRHPCAAIELPDDFEQYLAGLGSKFRQRYRQRTNKLLRSCETRFVHTESDGQLEAHLDTLFRLHQGRWVEAGHSGVFGDPRMRGFYLEVGRRLLRSNRLRFWQLEVDGVIRASQFGFAYAGVLYSLQEAYDSDFSLPGVSGLGVVLRGHALRSAIEEGLRRYDFLGGDQDHKLRWGASVHHVRQVRVARGGIAGRAAWLATGSESARASLKATLPRPILDAFRSTRGAYRRARTRRR